MSERPLPQPDPVTEFFWEGARNKQLLILHCDACSYWVHYPKPMCPRCGGPLQPKPVSGLGTIHSYTVTHRAVPGFEPTFVVALVELDEQSGLRMVSNVAGVEPDDVEVGMRVEVTFADAGDDVMLPIFARRKDDA